VVVDLEDFAQKVLIEGLKGDGKLIKIEQYQ